MKNRLDEIEKRLARVEKIGWVVLGMLLTKAGIDITPIVAALIG